MLRSATQLVTTIVGLAVILFLQILPGESSLVQGSAPAPPAEARQPGAPLPSQQGPYSPQQARKLFQLADERLEIELVACEPTIQSPVAMSFDEHGRLWVVEMPDYPNGPPAGQAPAGRIKILTDRDGDGFYETASIFAEGLLFANGLQLWKNGAFVTKAPELLYLAVTGGSGKADQRQVLYRGFAAENPQLRVSFPTLGWDGWVYCANGLRGGQVIRMGTDGQAAGNPVSLSNADFRFDPRRPERYEALTGPGQYGLAFDDWGERFVCDNRHHLRLVVFEHRYLRHNPYLAAPSLLHDISVLDRENNPSGAGGRVYPVSRNFTTSSLHAGHFSAACGIFVYLGDALPADYYGTVFTCEPPGNLVHVEKLRPYGATFEAQPMFDKKEFLASPDDWFRPVFLTTGPDGALYIVDMYRAVIEHPEYMPPELRQRPDLLWGKDKGRIWRVAQKHGRPLRRCAQGLGGLQPHDCLSALEHPNGWHRQTAFRLLLQIPDLGAQKAAMSKSLHQLARSAKFAQARALALWLLEHHEQLSKETLLAALTDPHPGVRQQAVRICDSRLQDPETRKALVQLAQQLVSESMVPSSQSTPEQARSLPDGNQPLAQRDRLGRLLLQLVLTLGALPESERLPILRDVAMSWCDDPWMRLAVLSSSGEATDRLLAVSLELSTLPPNRGAWLEWLREAAAVVGARKDDTRITTAVRALANKSADAAIVEAVLLGLAEGMSRSGGRFKDWWARVQSTEPGLAQIVEQAVALAAQRSENPRATSGERVRAIQLLAESGQGAQVALLRRLASTDPEPAVRLAAVRALSALGGNEVADTLVELWPAATPNLRRELVEALLRSPERILKLLEAVERGQIKPGELDAVRVRQLLQHRDASIRDRARRSLATSTPQQRQKVFETYRAALTKTGDVTRGRAVFAQHCAACHRIAGIGTNVGPDISDTRTKSPEQLLSDILLPNAAIDSNYVQYIVNTYSGKTVTGIIAAETPTSITLKRADNQTDTLLRTDIEMMQSTGLSLMPEGLEKEISIDQMADLLAFLKNWRYAQGQ